MRAARLAAHMAATRDAPPRGRRTRISESSNDEPRRPRRRACLCRRLPRAGGAPRLRSAAEEPNLNSAARSRCGSRRTAPSAPLSARRRALRSISAASPTRTACGAARSVAAGRSGSSARPTARRVRGLPGGQIAPRRPGPDRAAASALPSSPPQRSAVGPPARGPEPSPGADRGRDRGGARARRPAARIRRRRPGDAGGAAWAPPRSRAAASGRAAIGRRAARAGLAVDRDALSLRGPARRARRAAGRAARRGRRRAAASRRIRWPQPRRLDRRGLRLCRRCGRRGRCRRADPSRRSRRRIP